MKNTLIAGRIGAALSAFFLILFISFLMFILPSQGLDANQGGLYNPQAALAFASSSWLLQGFYAQYLVGIIGFSLLIYSIASVVESRQSNLMRIGNIVGIVGIVFFLINMVIGYLNTPLLLNLLPQYTQEVYATYLTITLLAGALVYGGFFCLGIWALFLNSSSLTLKLFPRTLSIIGIISGVCGVLSLFITPMSFLYILFSTIWLIYLAVIYPKLKQFPSAA
ncbi:MAG: hypothetical protein JEZ00_15415 [Anaerolineaceae bacterium]|nr:hypothetical protein [Anaerolineaceae bacterium]